MRLSQLAALGAPILLLACAAPDAPETGNDTNVAAAQDAAAPPPVAPTAPGTADGLPEDRAPVSKARFEETSAQGATNVVQTYYAVIEQGRHAEAWRLWSDEGRASGMSATEFAASFDRYAEYHVEVGAPGRIEGAAGSLYVEVPVVAYGRLKSGEPFRMAGTVTLRRVNEVPGSTAEQRRWHIAESAVSRGSGRD